MDDMINRSAVLDILNERFYDTEYQSEHEELEQKINNIPAIDAAVRRKMEINKRLRGGRKNGHME